MVKLNGMSGELKLGLTYYLIIEDVLFGGLAAMTVDSLQR